MVRFGFSRAGQRASAKVHDKLAAGQAPASPTPAAPAPGEIVVEIGLVLALHLAFAVAVLSTLDAYRVT